MTNLLRTSGEGINGIMLVYPSNKANKSNPLVDYFSYESLFNSAYDGLSSIQAL